MVDYYFHFRFRCYCSYYTKRSLWVFPLRLGYVWGPYRVLRVWLGIYRCNPRNAILSHQFCLFAPLGKSFGKSHIKSGQLFPSKGLLVLRFLAWDWTVLWVGSLFGARGAGSRDRAPKWRLRAASALNAAFLWLYRPRTQDHFGTRQDPPPEALKWMTSAKARQNCTALWRLSGQSTGFLLAQPSLYTSNLCSIVSKAVCFCHFVWRWPWPANRPEKWRQTPPNLRSHIRLIGPWHSDSQIGIGDGGCAFNTGHVGEIDYFDLVYLFAMALIISEYGQCLCRGNLTMQRLFWKMTYSQYQLLLIE